MKKILLPLLIICCTFSAFSNSEKDSIQPEPPKTIKTSQWAIKKSIGLLLTQTAFVNWNAGGDNSIAGIASADIELNYKKNRLFWNNSIKSRYGLNKKESEATRKTDDVFEIISNFGYQKSNNSLWYNSARFNFRTQFADGYKYPDRTLAISKLFAPAYIFLGVGSEYTSKDKSWKIYLSPLTNKTTLVFNQRLANSGAFGVEKAVYENDILIKEGENSKVEIGNLVSGEWKYDIMENVLMQNKLALYSDYINKYGNIDLDWELRFDLKVNKYVKANIGTHILYDDDVKDKATDGPKIQLKQLLGVGVTYSF